MITQSETIGEIVNALSHAQMMFEPIIKDVKAHRNKFAPLAACYKATRKALCDNGLIVTQQMNVVEDGICSILETTLAHTSGEFFKSYTNITDLLINFKNANPLHDWGSIITYTRRYAYLAIIGTVSEDEDDDGNIPLTSKNGNGGNTDYDLLKDILVEELRAKIKSSGVEVADFIKHHNISRKDVLLIKRSIDNFDELLINFKNSNTIVHSNGNGTDVKAA